MSTSTSSPVSGTSSETTGPEDHFLNSLKKLVKDKRPMNIQDYLSSSNLDADTYKRACGQLVEGLVNYWSMVLHEKSERKNAELLLKMRTEDLEKLGDKFEESLRKIGALQLKLDLSIEEQSKYQILLDARSLIEWVERTYFPTWLIQAKHISRFWKWLIALEFQLTPELKEISKRLADLKIPMREAARLIKETFGEISNSIIHKYPDLANLSDRNWTHLFDHLKVESNETSRMAMKSILVPVQTVEEDNRYSLRSDTKNYVLEVSFIGIVMDGTKLDKILEPYSEVEKYLIRPDIGISSFVFLLFNNITKVRINEVIEVLKSNGATSPIVKIANSARSYFDTTSSV